MSDPRGVGPVTIELNRTLAELLARLCVELDTEDVTGVMSRAPGLLDMAQHTKRQGGRLRFINEPGDDADLAIQAPFKQSVCRRRAISITGGFAGSPGGRASRTCASTSRRAR